MSDLHEVVFKWPSTDPSTVIATGTFDQWSSSIHLTKGADGFTGSTRVPYGEKIAYKFIVDGNWTTASGQATETDSSGNVNNVYTAPSSPPPAAEPAAEKVEEKPEVKEANGSVQDVASTVVAADGTSSATQYVASGVGAAIQGVIGVDPINSEKIPVETPKAETAPPAPTPAPVTATEAPVEVVPVNAAETVASAVPASTEAAVNSTPAPDAPSTHVPATSEPSAAAEPAIPPPVPEDKPAALTTTAPSEAAPPAEIKAEDTPAAAVNGKKEETPVPSPAPSAPSTPSKKGHVFPSGSAKDSPGSVKSTGSRKIRHSIFGKVNLKGLFGKDKEKGEEKK